MSHIVSELITFLDQVAPPHLQEDYDNAGLIVGNPHMTITGVLCCLDSTEAVLDEAIAKNCNVIVAHHPIIFRGLKKITGRDYIQKVIIKAIKNDLAIFAIHTNLDNVMSNGVNERIAKQLSLKELTILRPKKDDRVKEQVGAGVVGMLDSAVAELDFLKILKFQMAAGIVRHTELSGRNVQKIAVCGGSGSFLLQDAILAGADVFVTADFKYHEFFDANEQILICDIGHFESEQYTIDLIQLLISQNFTKFAAHCTKVNTNPIKYF